MKNKLITTFLLLSMTSSALVKAENKQQDTSIEDPGKISPLSKGKPAPYNGVLFSPKAAAFVATEIGSAKKKTEIEVEAAVKRSEAKKDLDFTNLKVECESSKKILTATSDERLKRISELENDLKSALAAAPSRTLWTTIGAVGGIALTLLTVFVVGQAIK